MALERYGFFNSTTEDTRSYTADALATAFRSLTVDGVASLGTCLQVTAEGSTMRTLIGYGSAVVQGYHYDLRDDGSGVMAFTHSVAAGADRLDLILLHLDYNARTISILKRDMTGVAPTSVEDHLAEYIQRTPEYHDLLLAKVWVRSGHDAISESDVMDMRADEEYCGVVLPSVLTLSTLWATIQAHTPNMKLLTYAPLTLSDAEKAIALANIGALGVLPGTYTPTEIQQARKNLRIYNDVADLGLTVTAGTTLEQVLAAMPDNALLLYAPASVTTSNLSPAANRYGTLWVYRVSAAQVTILYYPTGTAQMYRCYATYDSGAGTWTVGAWTAMIDASMIQNDQLGTDPAKVLAAPQGKVLGDEIDAINSRLAGNIVWNTPVAEKGTATVPDFADGTTYAYYISGTGMEIEIPVRAGTMVGVLASPITGGIRLYTLKITASGNVLTFDNMSRVDVVGGSVNGALATAAFSISTIRRLS